MTRVLLDGEFLLAVVEALRNTQSRVDVCCYEWAWYSGQRTGTVQDINRELCIAARRGVKVRVVLHNEAMGRHLGKINRGTAKRLRDAGCQVRMSPMQKPIHAKVWVFDGRTVVLGSHNISTNAVTRNAEAGVLVGDPSEVGRVLGWFEGLWGRGIGDVQE